MREQGGISEQSWNLLLEVVAKHRPGLQPLALSRQLVGDLCDAVMDEFCETGLLDTDEPNARGLSLEKVIDELRSYSRNADS